MKSFVAGKFRRFLEQGSFVDALPGHLGARGESGRLLIVLGRLRAIADFV